MNCRGQDRKTCLIETPEGSNSMIRIGLDRIRDYFPGPVDVSHRLGAAGGRDAYDLVVLLGILEDLGDPGTCWTGEPPHDGDAFTVKTLSRSPLVVAAAGVGARGTMFAAYRLAELLESGSDLASVDIQQAPAIKYRFGWIDHWSHGWASVYQPTVFFRTVHELPRYGVNGVHLGLPTPKMSDFGMLPFVSDKGILIPKQPQLAEWKRMIGRIKEYGLDIWMFFFPFVPPEFALSAIDEFYSGRTRLPGYEAALREHVRCLVTGVCERFPEIGFIEFNNAEGIETFPIRHLFFHPQDNAVCSRMLHIYLSTMLDVCRRHGRELMFGPHAFGATSDGLRAMREVARQYPEIILVEDDYWNNNGWLTLPVFGYIPEDLKADMHRRNRFGVRGIADAEYYGGGQLPSAAPIRLVASAQAARQRNAHIFILRVNHHTETEGGGSLWNINEIMMIAGMAHCWDPVPDTDTLWRRWVTRRFGAGAADILLPILKNCEELIRKGFSLQGLDILYGFHLAPGKWLGRKEANYNLFDVFRRPGQPLLEKTPADNLFSGEYMAFQARSTSIPMARIRTDQHRAMALIEEGLKAVESVRRNLSENDFHYLHAIYDDARLILKGIMLASEGAYATQLALDNYDQAPHPKAMLEAATRDLEDYADVVLRERPSQFLSNWAGIPLHQALRDIAAGYRRIARLKA